MSASIDEIDRAIIAATQSGLPLTTWPYDVVGRKVGLSGPEVRRRLQRMLEAGIIRRIGAVPNHYALGLKFNGMTVWDVADEQAAELGAQVGALSIVSHCYLRPRHLPVWPYNLFAMVHGKSRQEMDEKVTGIAALLGGAARGHAVLGSTRVLKKTGLRIAA